MYRASFRFEIVAQESLVIPLQGLVTASAYVTINAKDGHVRAGTVREVNDIGISLRSYTGTEFGFPWEAIERITLND